MSSVRCVSLYSMNSCIVDFQCILGSELLCTDIALVAEGVWEVYGLNVIAHFHPLFEQMVQ